MSRMKSVLQGVRHLTGGLEVSAGHIGNADDVRHLTGGLEVLALAD